MKKIIYCLTAILFFDYNLCAQQELSAKPEYFIQTKNVPGTTEIIFSFNAISTVYCHPKFDYNNWSICNNNCFNPAQEITYGNVTDIGHGWEICWDYDPNSPDEWQPIGYGLYLLTTNRQYSNANFYLDMRDGNYSHQGYLTTDFTIRYDWNLDQFEWCNTSGGFQSIRNGGLLQIWVIKPEAGIPNTSPFIGYWHSCLGINESNNHPKLVWGPHPNANPNSYLIYRATTLNPVPNPRTLNYQLRATVNSSTFYWIDPDVYLGGPNYNYYYVKPNNSNDISNIVGTSVSFYKRNNDYNNFQHIENKLSQNFPNPFNPLTKINYSIPQQTFVQLKIYDPFGKEVTVLVNESKEAGNYEVEFNAGILASGIYFYQLRTNNFISTKKMLVVK